MTDDLVASFVIPDLIPWAIRHLTHRLMNEDHSPDRPTIGHVVARLDIAGADRLAAGVARSLGARFRFVFLSLGPTGRLGQQLIGEEYKVVELRSRGLRTALTPLKIRQAIKRYRIDLLHAHQFVPLVLASLARLTSAHPPLIYTDHGRPAEDARRPRRAFAHKFLLRETDHITANGHHVRDMLADLEGLDHHRIRVITTGIDPDRFAVHSDDDIHVARKLLGFADNECVVMQVARFAPEKDHETTLRAFARTHDKVPDARLVLIGDGPTRPAMEQAAYDLGIAEHTRFLGHRDDVDALLPGADAFLLSSLTEGISPTLLEAMACRLPVIATHVGGNPEVVTHGSTGLLSQPRDVDSLAHNLMLLLHDPALRRRMGEAGRKRVLHHFTHRQMQQAYAKLYDHILND